MKWHEDGHSAAAFIDDEVMRVKLQCPGEEFCESRNRCHICEGEGTVVNGPFDEGETYRREQCANCKGAGVEPGSCHILQWANCTDPMELHHGRTDLFGVTFPAAIRWAYGDEEEGPHWRFCLVYPDEEAV
jgi:hypothetical protein